MRYRWTKATTPVPARLGLALAATVLLTGCGGGSDPATGHGGHDPAPSTSSSTTTAPNTTFNEADIAFLQHMIPHHQQAVEMSDIVATKTGIDPAVADLAKRIRAAQQPEITTMTGWLQDWGQPTEAHHHGDQDNGMLAPEQLEMLEQAKGADAQQLFLEGMIAHHDGAIEMAKAEIAGGQHPGSIELAKRIVATQQAEVAQMRRLLDS